MEALRRYYNENRKKIFITAGVIVLIIVGIRILDNFYLNRTPRSGEAVDYYERWGITNPSTFHTRNTPVSDLDGGLDVEDAVQMNRLIDAFFDYANSRRF